MIVLEDFKSVANYYEKLNKKKMGKKNVKNGNVLVVGDIHLPFEKEGYLEFCKTQYIKYNCTEVVFIGDIIDSHYSSYHEANPDGMSAGDELEVAIGKLKEWYKAFPEATVTIGNHDRIFLRKAFSAGLSQRWIKDINEVLEVPNWQFVDEVELYDVVYVHGEGGTAKTRVKQELTSIVQGHLHTQAYVEWSVGAKHRCFAMQVGCGIDRKSYAMAYAKTGKKPIIGCAVVLDYGKTPINLIMDLN